MYCALLWQISSDKQMVGFSTDELIRTCKIIFLNMGKLMSYSGTNFREIPGILQVPQHAPFGGHHHTVTRAMDRQRHASNLQNTQ